MRSIRKPNAINPAAVFEIVSALTENTFSRLSVPTNRTRVDESTPVLTFNHDFFRHEEMELFVAERGLAQVTTLPTRMMENSRSI